MLRDPFEKPNSGNFKDVFCFKLIKSIYSTLIPFQNATMSFILEAASFGSA